MSYRYVRGIAVCARRLFLAGLLFAQIGSPQATPGQLTPGQNPSKPAGQNQPGKVGAGQDSPVQSVPSGSAPGDAGQAPVPGSAAPQAPPLIFESRGLEYEAITRNGITVMFATLPSRIRDFNIVQVTVTNGALVTWTVRPSDFSFVRQDGTMLNSVSADEVVETLLQRADRDDVIKLQLLYENSIYGLANFRSTNGYEKRREAAMAQFVNRGFKAAAEASAITLVPIKLKSGDSTDGAVFFENRTKERGLGAGRFIAHTCGETFMFETYAELRKH